MMTCASCGGNIGPTDSFRTYAGDGRPMHGRCPPPPLITLGTCHVCRKPIYKGEVYEKVDASVVGGPPSLIMMHDTCALQAQISNAAASFKTAGMTMAQAIQTFQDQIFLQGGDTEQLAAPETSIRVKRSKSARDRAKEAARRARLEQDLRPDCCDDPRPRIAVRSGRLYCAACQIYLDRQYADEEDELWQGDEDTDQEPA